jgi:acetylornithine deacetylase
LQLVDLARALIDIDSTTGREAEACGFLASELRSRGYQVTEQPVADGRFNVLALVDPRPLVVLSTHIDCVPPFFPSRVADGVLHGRGACDAKGALAAQIVAAERLRASGEQRLGLLLVVGEERGSDGALRANELAPGARFLLNGEPTESRLGSGTRGVLRVKLRARGKAAHSSQPERGENAIDKLVDALVALRTLALPEDETLGKTFYSVGLVGGGVAPNVIPPSAEAELLFRTVGPGRDVLERLAPLRARVAVEQVLEVPPVRLRTLPGFEARSFAFTTDIPLLTRWGEPLLFGPGSVLDAHTDDDHVRLDELAAAADTYAALARALVAEAGAPETRPAPRPA